MTGVWVTTGTGLLSVFCTITGTENDDPAKTGDAVIWQASSARTIGTPHPIFVARMALLLFMLQPPFWVIIRSIGRVRHIWFM
jgi:hypothetical protein